MNSAPQNEQLLLLPSYLSLPKTSAPQYEHLKKAFRKWQFLHWKREQSWSKKWLDRCVGKGFWAKKSAQLVILVRSSFQNDLHLPIGGPHPVLYFTTQITKKYCTAMCYPCQWLTHSCLVYLTDVTLAPEDANSKLLDVISVADIDAQERVDDSLVGFLKLKFGEELRLRFG